jgi:hypothetical protein
MIISKESFRARLQNLWADHKNQVLGSDATPKQKYWELQYWIDGFESAALLAGMDTTIADIIEEVTGDTLSAWRDRIAEQGRLL